VSVSARSGTVKTHTYTHTHTRSHLDSSLESRVNNIIKRWNWVEKTLVGILIFSATLISFYTVMTRYCSTILPTGRGSDHLPIIWVFLSLQPAGREREHVAATLLVERFPSKCADSWLFSTPPGLCFCVLIFIFGLKLWGMPSKRREVLTALGSRYGSPTYP